MQWVEEADRNDDILPLKTPYKAFSGYTLPDGRKVALWKHAVTSISSDGGNTWRYPGKRAHGFVNSNAKIWGQRLSDGTYATVYNPAEYRWPLAISLSKDGLEYTRSIWSTARLLLSVTGVTTKASDRSTHAVFLRVTAHRKTAICG